MGHGLEICVTLIQHNIIIALYLSFYNLSCKVSCALPRLLWSVMDDILILLYCICTFLSCFCSLRFKMKTILSNQTVDIPDKGSCINLDALLFPL